MKKPSAAAIRDAEPLTGTRYGEDLGFVCICGTPAPDLQTWREHDEHDRAIPGADAVVFLARSHRECKRRLDEHPRLYSEVTAYPGYFPGLCDDCRFRKGRACRHPDLKANGGAGLKVSLAGFGGFIICTLGSGCHTPVGRGAACAGKDVRGG